MSEFIKEELMVSNNYIAVTTFLIDVANNQKDTTFTVDRFMISRCETIKISGKKVRIQAARLYDAICQDDITPINIATLELSDFVLFIEYLSETVSYKFIRDYIFHRKPDNIVIAKLRVIEVISEIIFIANNCKAGDHINHIISKGLYRDENEKEIINWYEEESNTDAP